VIPGVFRQYPQQITEEHQRVVGAISNGTSAGHSNDSEHASRLHEFTQPHKSVGHIHVMNGVDRDDNIKLFRETMRTYVIAEICDVTLWRSSPGALDTDRVRVDSGHVWDCLTELAS
jgi:hypothetical protein